MVTVFNPPTRSQLATLSRGDERLLRSLEALFVAVGQDAPAGIDELALKVELNTQAIAALDLRVGDNEVGIRSNEVLLWLSM